VCAIVIPNIGDAITIVGATTNPIIGFSIPIIFYLKMSDDKFNAEQAALEESLRTKKSCCSMTRVVAHSVNVVVLLAGLGAITLFVVKKSSPDLLK